ncbi:Cyclin-T1-4 protein [Spatholobus suberectus]|nr:Cyclin-T1-4 protein [Spatholobus suberectus]
MSFGWNLQAQGHGLRGGYCPTFDRSNNNNGNRKRSRINYYHGNYNIHNNYWAEHGGYSNVYYFDSGNYAQYDAVPSSLKRRKHPAPSWENSQKYYYLPSTVQGNIPSFINYQAPPSRSNVDTSISPICKLDCSIFEDSEPVFMSRDEIDRCSPSRKDGIDVLHETHLRYSYCTFLHNLGMRLNLPQTTIGTAMILCHRFFFRRSHACHDRFVIDCYCCFFLAGKSEETSCPLNNVLRVSSEILHKQDFTLLSYLLPVDWFEKYHDRVLEAELLLLTTLNFELNVQHPYASLTSVLDKLGPSRTSFGESGIKLDQQRLIFHGILILLACIWCRIFIRLATGLSKCRAEDVELALALKDSIVCNVQHPVLQSSLWLQYKPHHIAAGAAYLASKFLNIDLTAYHIIWQEFEATSSIVQDVSQQLMELI